MTRGIRKEKGFGVGGWQMGQMGVDILGGCFRGLATTLRAYAMAGTNPAKPCVIIMLTTVNCKGPRGL